MQSDNSRIKNFQNYTFILQFFFRLFQIRAFQNYTFILQFFFRLFQIRAYQSLDEKLQAMDASLALNPQYVQKVKLVPIIPAKYQHKI